MEASGPEENLNLQMKRHCSVIQQFSLEVTDRFKPNLYLPILFHLQSLVVAIDVLDQARRLLAASELSHISGVDHALAFVLLVLEVLVLAELTEQSKKHVKTLDE